MIHFLDSSAFVKRFVVEHGHAEVAALFRADKDLAVARVAAIEVPAALARRARAGDLPNADARRHARQARKDLSGLRVIELRPPVVDIANELVWRHPLRAYDALQLASALRLAHATGLAVTFWCADRALTAAARAEQVRTRFIG